MIRLARPDVAPEDMAEVARILETGHLVQGPTVQAFEAAFAARTGAAYAVAVSSGTSALFLTLQALELKPGDEVIVPAFSWPATANAVTLSGATPIFADVDSEYWNIDTERVAELLGRHDHVRAILPVDGFGCMAPLAALEALTADTGVALIEDAACAVGASAEGRPAGSWGLAGCFSFHPRKIVTTGEGGMITTSDADLARRLRMLRNHGLDPDAGVPTFARPGFNMRLTEFQAALGLAQMERLDELLAGRRRIAGWYRDALAGLPLTLPDAGGEGSHVYQSYVVLLPDEAAGRRGDIIAALRSAGVETTIGTYHIPLTDAYRDPGGHRPGDFPVTDTVARRALTLPMHSALSRDDVATVAAALGEALRAHTTGESS